VGLSYIHHHQVPTFGFEPGLFVVLSAFIEFVIAYLLVVGILNRLLALVVTVLFILTMNIFSYTEVVGYGMIHIVLIFFIIEGISIYDSPIRIHKTRIEHISAYLLSICLIQASN
jgi:uncharacterized membrane protein YphA (DoxX/SURF4 family)